MACLQLAVGGRWRRLVRLVCGSALMPWTLGMGFGIDPAAAEVGTPTPTVQAVAADATWLAYAPAPAHPGVVCMVDSGVDPNPDTETAVIGGQAIASETDTLDEVARLEPRVQPGNHPDGHGTLMAMMMAAPMNGWGMVGIAPTSVRVYNMKALPKGQTTFPFDYYAVAIEGCQRLRAQSSYAYMSVINLSLGGDATPGHSELIALENYVATAQRAGLAVVAAAGNDGGSVLYPAAYPPILAIGAGEVAVADGALCMFASRGENLDLIAPGCDSQTGGLQGVFEDDGTSAVGSGSSQASALVSAVLASMRAYAPQLTLMRAEECLTTTSKNGLVDVASAFEACGLSQLVREGKAAEASASSPQATDPRPTTTNTGVAVDAVCIATSCGQPPPPSSRPRRHEAEASCPRPQIVEGARHRKRLVLRVGSHPTSCRLQARWRTKRGPRVIWLALISKLPDVLRASSSAGFGELQIRYRGDAGRRISSPWEGVHIG